MNKEDRIIESAVRSGFFLGIQALTLGHRMVTDADFNKLGIGTPVLDRDFGSAKSGDWIRAFLEPTEKSEPRAKDMTCIVYQEVRPRSVGLLGTSCGPIQYLPDSIKRVL